MSNLKLTVRMQNNIYEWTLANPGILDAKYSVASETPGPASSADVPEAQEQSQSGAVSQQVFKHASAIAQSQGEAGLTSDLISPSQVRLWLQTQPQRHSPSPIQTLGQVSFDPSLETNKQSSRVGLEDSAYGESDSGEEEGSEGSEESEEEEGDNEAEDNENATLVDKDDHPHNNQPNSPISPQPGPSRHRPSIGE